MDDTFAGLAEVRAVDGRSEAELMAVDVEGFVGAAGRHGGGTHSLILASGAGRGGDRLLRARSVRGAFANARLESGNAEAYGLVLSLGVFEGFLLVDAAFPIGEEVSGGVGKVVHPWLPKGRSTA